jgi:hypothetical protein
MAVLAARALPQAGRALLVAAAVAAVAPPAAAADGPRREDPPYAFGLRAAAVEPYLVAGRELPFAVGFSHVDLAHESAGFRCDAVAAGYWLGVYEERGLLYTDADPHRGNGPAGPNPTAARVSRPARAEWPDQTPVGPDGPGPGPNRTADCDDAGTAGRGASVELDGAGVRVAGSAATGAIDAAGGRYTGTGRAYVQGLAPSTGALDALTSSLAVTAAPGEQPTVTYRLTLFGVDPGGGARSEFDGDAVSVAGRDVPLGDLVRRFQDQVRARARELAPFLTPGVTLLEPVVSSQDGRLSVTAPAVAAAFGVTVLSERYLGREQGVRLGAVTYTSRHPLRPKEPHL